MSLLSLYTYHFRFTKDEHFSERFFSTLIFLHSCIYITRSRNRFSDVLLRIYIIHAHIYTYTGAKRQVRAFLSLQFFLLSLSLSLFSFVHSLTKILIHPLSPSTPEFSYFLERVHVLSDSVSTFILFSHSYSFHYLQASWGFLSREFSNIDR